MNSESNKQGQRELCRDTLLAEYRSLREEIGRNSQLTATVFLANVTATGVLFGFGFETSKWTIFLSPFAILIPSLFFISSQLESTTRIASYLKIVLEPRLRLSWESDWWKVRECGTLPRRRKYTLSVSGLFGTLSVSCVFLAALYCDMASLWKLGLTIVPLAILVALGVYNLVGAFSPTIAEEYDAMWSKLGVARDETARHHVEE